MNQDSTGLVIFALVALAAVFAFILVFGPATTGQLSGEQKLGTSWYKVDDAFAACARASFCNDGLPGKPTGKYDPLRELFECQCQTSDQSVYYYRSAYHWG